MNRVNLQRVTTSVAELRTTTQEGRAHARYIWFCIFARFHGPPAYPITLQICYEEIMALRLIEGEISA